MRSMAVAVTPDGRLRGLRVSGQDAEGVGPGQRARAAHSHRPQEWCQWRGGDAGRAAGGLRVWDKTLKVWDVGSGRELRTLTGHASCGQWRWR